MASLKALFAKCPKVAMAVALWLVMDVLHVQDLLDRVKAALV